MTPKHILRQMQQDWKNSPPGPDGFAARTAEIRAKEIEMREWQIVYDQEKIDRAIEQQCERMELGIAI